MNEVNAGAMNTPQTSPSNLDVAGQRYIPYSGGSMGWFDNSGVLKSELSNNYLFYTLMDATRVQAKQFERWGGNFNRRGTRVRVRKETTVSVVGEEADREGVTRDISLHGMRLQFLEPVEYLSGSSISVQVLNPEGEPVMSIEASVCWVHQRGRLRPVWDVGVAFATMTPELTSQLKDFLGQ